MRVEQHFLALHLGITEVDCVFVELLPSHQDLRFGSGVVEALRLVVDIHAGEFVVRVLLPMFFYFFIVYMFMFMCIIVLSVSRFLLQVLPVVRGPRVFARSAVGADALPPSIRFEPRIKPRNCFHQLHVRNARAAVKGIMPVPEPCHYIGGSAIRKARATW